MAWLPDGAGCTAARYAAGDRLTFSEGLNTVKTIDYVGSNPTGENRCLVDKAQSRHRSRVALKEEDSESAGIASEWRSGAAEGLPVPSEEKNRALSHGAAERKKPDSRTGAGLIRGTARRIFCGGFRVGIADSFERKGKK